MSTRISPKNAIKGLFYFLGFPLILFLVSGNWEWASAWVYVGVSYLTTLLGRFLMAKRNPDLIKERVEASGKTDAKPWDRILGPLVAFWLPLVYFVIAGLDKRLGWSAPIPPLIQVIAWITTLAGFTLSTWALVENRFFSSVVRIQSDRGQKVVNTGPYRLMRHPGYAGAVLVALSFPLILGTLWAYPPIALFLAAVITRTSLEDRTLQNELPGYSDYCLTTRFRLFPGLW